MPRKINKVAVMGTGTMGAGIAALCANAGKEVLFMDVRNTNGPPNAIALESVKKMSLGKLPMLKDDAAISRVNIGNFGDDISSLADADWIVEAIVEDLKIKRELFEKIEKFRSEGSVVTTNTSGIMLKAITEGMPDRLRRDVAVTHFFNPVLVMKLVELVPGVDTKPDVLEHIARFLEDDLDKGVVWAKDTVNFIANRIGCFWMLAGITEAMAVLEGGHDIEEIDAVQSAPVGIPPTGLYGLLDLVGLDVLRLVAENLTQNLPSDDAGLKYCTLPPPINEMLKKGQVGRKSGGGFYRMTELGDGSRIKEKFDIKNGTWRKTSGKSVDLDNRSFENLMFGDDSLSKFTWDVVGATLLYASDLIPEIADDIVNVDRAMTWGFNWRQGPFEMLDALGPRRVIERLNSEAKALPRMLQVLSDVGAPSFYRDDGREFLTVNGDWCPTDQ